GARGAPHAGLALGPGAGRGTARHRARRRGVFRGGDRADGMTPIFANPAGLWALLAVPAILAIHFLQQRARIARTSTWFLIEKLAPDSARGRTWDRLRSSRTLWLQLLAVLI